MLYTTLIEALEDFLRDKSLEKRTKDNKFIEEYTYLLK